MTAIRIELRIDRVSVAVSAAIVTCSAVICVLICARCVFAAASAAARQSERGVSVVGGVLRVLRVLLGGSSRLLRRVRLGVGVGELAAAGTAISDSSQANGSARARR